MLHRGLRQVVCVLRVISITQWIVVCVLGVISVTPMIETDGMCSYSNSGLRQVVCVLRVTVD